uniref:Transposase-associated domain-containing protein n=1 Tax=Tanacetum cinerariifolium TaxID=118510 RepID=A0A699IG90_TANCI|nr:hypothetical protein [Tanacetum cinerariifolium]
MDKSLMGTNMTNKSYIDGVATFIDYAVHNFQKMRTINPQGNKQHLLMPCLCTKCLNPIERKVEEVHFYLFKNKIDLSYTKWSKHGEKDELSISALKHVNATTEFVDDVDFALDIPTDGPATVEMVNATKDNFDEDDLVKFQELLSDTEKPLYKVCPDFTKLSAIVKLLNLKGKYGCSDKFFTELLGLLKKMLPDGNEMVEKTYQAKKIMKLIGSGYKKIHVCINNCLVYWKDDKDLTVCRTCGISRWKVDNKTHKVYENILAKVMWYFSFIPRLQRLFKIQSISEDLRWHTIRRITDGVLRHPVDSQAWRTIEEKFPEIAKNPRNLRLGISADSGFKDCVVCGKDTYCVRLSTSSKQSYGVHKQYLPYNHAFKKQKKAFNGQQEFLLALNLMIGEQIYNETKDRVNARLDLAELGVKPELFATQEEDKTTLPPAGRKLIGLKLHDYHMLMQEFLPIAIRSIMHKPTQYAIIRFFFFFRSICSKEIRFQELDKMEEELVVTLSLLEKLFPSLFFDIMVHLTVHCGPTCFRWTYPFKRCMKVIKGHVQNKNRLEGCIAKDTTSEKTIEFFSEYHKSIKTIGILPDKHETNENEEGKPLSSVNQVKFLWNSFLK